MKKTLKYTEHPCPKCGQPLLVFANIESKSTEERIGNFLDELSKKDEKLHYHRRRVWIRYVCKDSFRDKTCEWKGEWIKIQDIIKGGKS